MENIEIIGVLSESGMYRILKARRGTKFVVLKAARTADAMHTEMLRREYELARGLNHSCIVPTLGFEEDTPAGSAVVMEYARGCKLDEYMDTRPSARSRRNVLNDILDGVGYLHHRGIIHKDLKPENIIVNDNGTARIIDFSLSGSDDSIYTGVTGGTEGFSAPEVVDGAKAAPGPLTGRADIYSIGCLIRFLFGGRRYVRTADRCCSPDPAERFASVEQLRRAIRREDTVPWIGIAAALVAAGIALALALPQIIGKVQSDTLETRMEREMDTFFLPALDSIKAQEYNEFAGIFLGWYTMREVAFRDSVITATGHGVKSVTGGWVSKEHEACEMVAARQMKALQEACSALPCITALPADRQWPLMEELDRRSAIIFQGL